MNSLPIVDSSPLGRTITNVVNGSETVTINTSILKFGGGSGYFSGQNSSTPGSLRFTSAVDPVVTNSSTAFTVEYWVYVTANRANNYVFSKSYPGTDYTVNFVAGFNNGSNLMDTAGLYPAFGFYSNNGSGWNIGAVANAAISLNTWYHIACVFTGSSSKIYVNGQDVTNSAVTPASSWNVPPVTTVADNWYVGRRWDGGSSNYDYFGGYIDDLRITKGIARYTGNFSVPTAQFPDTATGGSTGTGVVVADHSAMSNSQLKATITYPITVTRANSTTQSIVATQVLAKAVQGPQGPSGSGATGPRNASGYVYYTVAASSSPGTPGSSGSTPFDFTAANFSSLTASWATTFSVPTAVSTTSGLKYWASRYTVSESSFGGTQTYAFSTPFVWTNFDGLVTFTNLNEGKDATGNISKTMIDGGSIKSNSITTNSLTVTGFGDSAIMNASFEEADAIDNTMPAKWIRGSIGGTQILTGYNTNGYSSNIYRNTADYYSGSASLVLFPGAGYSASAYSESIPVAAGDIWYVSCRAKLLSGSNANSLHVRIAKDVAAGSSPGGNYIACEMEGVTLTNNWVQYSGKAQIPAGWTKARILILQWQTNTGGAIAIDEIEWKKATGPAQISSINADTITVGTLTADRIRFSNVGNNAILNSSCATGIEGWSWGDSVPTQDGGGTGAPTPGTFRWINSESTWRNVYGISPYGGTVTNWVGSFANGTSLGWQGMANDNRNGDLVVTAGDRVELSIYVMNHRCKASLRLGFYNAANTALNEVEIANSGSNYFQTTGTLQEWAGFRIGGFYDIPANGLINGQKVSHCKWRIYAEATTDSSFYYSGGNPYQFVCLPFLSKAAKNQTQLTPWSEGTKTGWSYGFKETTFNQGLNAYQTVQRYLDIDIIGGAVVEPGDIVEVTSTYYGAAAVSYASQNVQTGTVDGYAAATTIQIGSPFTTLIDAVKSSGGYTYGIYSSSPYKPTAFITTRYLVTGRGRFRVNIMYENYNISGGYFTFGEQLEANYVWYKRQ
jgi:hypothetical protein